MSGLMGDRKFEQNAALNALRACSALLVVAGHARGFLFVGREDVDSPVAQVALALLSLGHGAVIVFFVMSGYFVGGSVLAGVRTHRFRWRSYATSRLTRLWIVLLPAVLLTLILDLVGRTFFGGSKYYDASSSAAANSDLGTVLGNIFFLQPVHVEALGSNGPLWSLSYEACYYALFPLLLIAVFYCRRKWHKLMLISLAAFVIVVFGWNVLALFPAWLLGAGAAYFKDPIVQALSRWSVPALQVSRVATLGFLVVAMVTDKIMGGSPDYAPPTTYLVAVVATVLVALLLTDMKPKGQVARATLRFFSGLSHSSYSLYAVHAPILSLGTAALGVGGATGLWRPELAPWLAYIGIIALLVFLGWLFAAATERHTGTVRRLVRRHFGRSSRRAPSPDVPAMR